jgi:hypothetical protein
MGAYLIVGVIAFLPALAVAKYMGVTRTVSGEKVGADPLGAFYGFTYFFLWIMAGVALFVGDGNIAMILFGFPIVASIMITSLQSILSKD